MASNTVLRKFAAPTGKSAADLARLYQRPSYRAMTLDDVVVRTAAMLAVLLTAAAASWLLTPAGVAGPVVLVALMGGVGLGLYMSFTMRANAVTALLYSGFEGVLLGAVSRAFNAAYPGIVVQAVTGTLLVAVVMVALYQVRAVRVTSRLRRVAAAATLGAFALMLVNLAAYLVTPDGLGLRSGGPLAVLFSVVCIVLAAVNLAVDFDVVERAIAGGKDASFAWYASFGLMVTLIWLYVEILRLLSYLNRD